MSPPSSEPYTVGQYLADRLHELGIEHLFAIPGDYCAEWVHKYVEKNPNIERIGSTNEMNAGYAADGYARMNGIGAVCVTYSVGAFSLLNPIAGAFVERVPVVAINGAPSTKKRLQFRETGFQWHHLIDDQDTDLRVYENVTCAAERIADPERAPGQIDSALRACLRESRPVYLEMLEDVYDLPCDPPERPLAVQPGQRSNPGECDKAVEAIAQHLQQADSAVVWGGVEIERYNLQDEFQSLVEALDVPYVTSLLGKGLLSEENARFAGVFDGNGSPQAVQKLVKDADYVLGLGAWLTDENLLGWMFDTGRATLAYRDVVRDVSTSDPGIDRQRSKVYTAVGLRNLLSQLQADAATSLPSFSGTDVAAQTRTQVQADRSSSSPAPDEQITYQGFYDTITEYVEEDSVVMGGTGLNFFGSLELPVDTQSGFVSQAAYADIGYVTPASIGVDLGTDGERVMVFAGDGGFQMTAQCLGTMAEEELNPIIFVINNGVYGIEQWLADPAVFGNDEPFYPLAVIQQWNYSQLPEAFGGKGWRVETYGELETAVEDALNHTGGPLLIEVKVPQKSLPELAEFKVEAAEKNNGNVEAALAAAP
jgi:indolepyruvate decarboxylase